MIEEDHLKKLFDRVRPEITLEDAPEGHTHRFVDRLNNEKANTAKQKKLFWKPLSIAASVIVLLGIGILLLKPVAPEEIDLASVSPEMQETQSFFTMTIHQELEKLKSIETADTKKLVDDALKQLVILEKEYSKLKIDLKTSGNNKLVIHGMINNFQKRIEILQDVIAQIDNINKLKLSSNETIL